ncbi:MAG: hypothetical protein RIS94_519 [Pseudomonadota bacterium]|jgi:Ca2+-binding RTX toxin-like protein
MSGPNVINGDAGADVLVGTGDADAIYGLGGGDTLTGLEGDDLLDGGSGADTMAGGLGNDTYVVDNLGDSLTEAVGAGIDTVLASISWALGANFENLTLTGSSVINAIGNALDNVLIGNDATNILTGGAGADVLDGGVGADTLIGGSGNDTYYLDSAADVVVEALGDGFDTIYAGFSRALGDNVENMVLTGMDAIDAFGNLLDNRIVGNAASNVLTGEGGADTLDGGAGADTLIGGAADDTYVVDDAGDIVTEQAGEGTDTVRASISYALSAAVENLVLTGADAIDGTGNELANRITGNAAANVLSGGDGADTLDGNGGPDTLVGGLGNDTYVVDDTGDVVTELADQGTDTVQAGIAFELAGAVENLVLTGADAIDGTGNDLANALTGNVAANALTGLGGDDTLDGGAGADTLVGGFGDDTYVVDDAGDVVTELAGQGTDTVRSAITYVLGEALENLVLTGAAAIDATGNAFDNRITGNAAANVIDGDAGADIMTGGRGNDTYVVDDAGDVVVEAANGGIDTVRASVSVTLSGSVENLMLTGNGSISGTGNALANSITGTAARNVIDGAAGRDFLDGGEGGDLYLIAMVGDHPGGEFTDTGASGIDEVRITIVGAGGVGLHAGDLGIERVVIGTGTAAEADRSGTDAINVNASTVRNGLEILGNAGANKIKGTAYADIIDGGAGADIMSGGKGSDIYYVDDSADKVTEGTGGGLDHVFASQSFRLAGNVEWLTLTGAGAINGTGNSGANTLEGNDGANVLDGDRGNDILSGGGGADLLVGGLGLDTLTGGAGADRFRFNKPVSGTDRIVDFSHAEGDVLELNKAGFTKLGAATGALSADQFWSGAGVQGAHDAGDRIIYDTDSGSIWYDADGTGRAVATLIAVMEGAPALAATDFLIVA